MSKTDGSRSAQRHLRGPRRSHPASDPFPSFPGRGFGHGARQTIRLEPSRHLETSKSAAARGTGEAEPEGAVAAVPAGRRPLEGGSRLGGRVPAGFGGEVLGGRPTTCDTQQKKKEKKQKVAHY